MILLGALEQQGIALPSLNLWGNILTAWEMDDLTDAAGNYPIVFNQAPLIVDGGVIDDAYGSTGYQEMSTAVIPEFGTATDFTVMGWVKPRGSGFYGRVFRLDTNTTTAVNELFTIFMVNTDDAIGWSIAESVTYYGWNGTIAAGTYFHLAVTYNKTTNDWKLYVDGIHRATRNAVAYTNAAIKFSMFRDLSQPANSNNDLVRIFTRELTEEEVLAHVNGGVGLAYLASPSFEGAVAATNPIAWYDFQQADYGTALVDISGEGHDLTRVGGATPTGAALTTTKTKSAAWTNGRSRFDYWYDASSQLLGYIASQAELSITMVYAHNSLTQSYSKICGWKNGSSTQGLVLDTQYSSGTNVNAESRTNTSNNTAVGSANADLDTHIWTTTWKDGVLSIWKDGVFINSVTHASGVLLYASPWRFEIGGSMLSAGSFNGFTEHVHVNDFALPDADIINMHEALLAELPLPPVNPVVGTSFVWPYTSGANLIPAVPETIEGDVILLYMQTRNSYITSVPAGFTPAWHRGIGSAGASQAPGGAYNEESALYLKIATASEPTDYSVTCSGTDNMFGLCVFRNVNIGNSAKNDNSNIAPDILMNGAKSWLVCVNGTSYEASGPPVIPAGMTLVDSKYDAGQDVGIIVAYEELGSGQTGTRTFTAPLWNSYAVAGSIQLQEKT